MAICYVLEIYCLLIFLAIDALVHEISLISSRKFEDRDANPKRGMFDASNMINFPFTFTAYLIYDSELFHCAKNEYT